MKRNFMELLQKKWDEKKFVCVGLDSELEKIPACVASEDCGVVLKIFSFNSAIVDATKDIVGFYKPNIAFYEAHGEEGITALYNTIAFINKVAPDVPVILDAKRADIGNTNNGYVNMLDDLGADAITVHPYLGKEALKPFLDRKDKGVIVLCRTSNPGAGELQDVDVEVGRPRLEKWGIKKQLMLGELFHMPLCEYVAYSVSRDWNDNGNCVLVVGATCPIGLEDVRRIVGNMPILIPGVGFQQKDIPLEEQVDQVVNAGMDSRGQGMIINSSRGIIFASKGEDFAEAAGREAKKLHDLITKTIAAAMEEVEK